MIQLALLRHGHTHWNREGRIQGRTDVPLDEDAVSHLSALELPTPWLTCDLVASPLSRALQTAHLVSGREATTIGELTEMDWGDWEGQRGVDLAADPTTGFRHIEEWGWDFRPPNGESPADLRNRLSKWLDTLTQDTVAVCHIGIMRVLLAMATGWNFEGEAPFRVKRNRLFIFNISSEGLSFQPETVRLVQRT